MVCAWTGTVRASRRCFSQELHAYRKASSMYCSALSCKSSTSEFVTAPGRLHMFFSNLRLISLRQRIKSCGWWSRGEIRNLLSVHRAGSTMKSGKVLWKGRTGRSTLSWRIRSECMDERRGNTSSVWNPRSAAIADGERGFAVRTTAPMTERILESS